MAGLRYVPLARTGTGRSHGWPVRPRGRLRPRRHVHEPVTDAHSVAHVSADLTGVGSGPLRDAALLSGLLIAAAGAAGLNATGTPIVRSAPAGGISAVLFLDPCHVSIHSLPERGLALVDVLARDRTGADKALEVFVRRLAPVSVTTDTRMRG